MVAQMTLEETVVAGIIVHSDDHTGPLPMEVTQVRKEYFVDTRCRAVWGAIERLLDQEVKPDLLTVTREFGDSGKVAPWLMELTSMVASTANLDYWVGKFVAEAKDRILRQAMTAAAKGDSPAEDALRAIEEADTAAKGGMVKASSVLAGYARRIDQRRENPSSYAAATTGFEDLDHYVPLARGALTIIAARPSMGKTMLVLNIAKHAAASVPVAVFSLEQTRDALLTRLAVIMSGTAEKRLIHRDCAQHFTKAMQDIHSLDLYIDERNPLTARQIDATASSVPGIGLVVVDYLGLVTYGKAERHDLGVGSVTKAQKAMAKRLGCHVLLLSQLNRDCEKRPGKRPQLSDLRDSGAIEQDADAVIMLYREAYYHPDCNHNQTELLIRKNREGPTGCVKLTCDPETYRFYEEAK